MALSWPHVLQFRSQPSLGHTDCVLFSDLTESGCLELSCTDSFTLFRRCKIFGHSPVALKPVKCLARSTEEKQWSDDESVLSDSDEVADERNHRNGTSLPENGRVESQRIATTSSGDTLSQGIREPVYEVVEVKSNGKVSTRKINRRQLLKSSGLRPPDIRSVDPSLFMTNSMPALLVREYAILLNLASLRAIAMQDCVLIFDNNWRRSFSRDIAASIEPQEQQWRAINAI